MIGFKRNYACVIFFDTKKAFGIGTGKDDFFMHSNAEEILVLCFLMLQSQAIWKWKQYQLSFRKNYRFVVDFQNYGIINYML